MHCTGRRGAHLCQAEVVQEHCGVGIAQLAPQVLHRLVQGLVRLQGRLQLDLQLLAQQIVRLRWPSARCRRTGGPVCLRHPTQVAQGPSALLMISSSSLSLSSMHSTGRALPPPGACCTALKVAAGHHGEAPLSACRSQHCRLQSQLILISFSCCRVSTWRQGARTRRSGGRPPRARMST